MNRVREAGAKAGIGDGGQVEIETVSAITAQFPEVEEDQLAGRLKWVCAQGLAVLGEV
jgi:hypothetical protein